MMHIYFVVFVSFEAQKPNKYLKVKKLFIQTFTIILYMCVTKHDVIVLACRRLDSVADLTSSHLFVTVSRVRQATIANRELTDI